MPRSKTPFLTIMLFFTLFATPPVTQATQTEEELRRREEDSLERFRTQCVNRDFAAEHCDVVVQTADMYQPTLLALPARAGIGLISGVTDFVRGSIDVASWAANGDTSFEESTTGRRIRGSVIGELRRMMAEDGVTPCHKACMIKCASDALLDWVSLLDTKFGSTSHIYERGQGECTEFQRVALDLASALDVPASPAYGVRHAFVSFNINGYDYMAEPQNSRCDFFFQEDLTETEIASREEILNEAMIDTSRRVVDIEEIDIINPVEANPRPGRSDRI